MVSDWDSVGLRFNTITRKGEIHSPFAGIRVFAKRLSFPLEGYVRGPGIHVFTSESLPSRYAFLGADTLGLWLDGCALVWQVIGYRSADARADADTPNEPVAVIPEGHVIFTGKFSEACEVFRVAQSGSRIRGN